MQWQITPQNSTHPISIYIKLYLAYLANDLHELNIVDGDFNLTADLLNIVFSDVPGFPDVSQDIEFDGPDGINDVMIPGACLNLSVAYMLANSDLGREMLLANDYDLATQINIDVLNRMIIDEPNRGFTVALCLAKYESVDGVSIFAARGYKLARMISVNTLNSIVTTGSCIGESVALYLSSDAPGCRVLMANDFALARQISTPTLNIIIPEEGGENAGTSTAFWLSCVAEGLSILELDNYRLALQIYPLTLNKLVYSLEEHQNISTAFMLAKEPVGLNILIAHGFALASSLDVISLNAVVPQGNFANTSVAYWLAKDADLKGVAILSLNQFALARQMSAYVLNNIVTSSLNSIEDSVAINLTMSPQGRDVLACNNYLLASQIDLKNLNKIVSRFDEFDPNDITLCNILSAAIKNNIGTINIFDIINNPKIPLTVMLDVTMDLLSRIQAVFIDNLPLESKIKVKEGLTETLMLLDSRLKNEGVSDNRRVELMRPVVLLTFSYIDPMPDPEMLFSNNEAIQRASEFGASLRIARDELRLRQGAATPPSSSSSSTRRHSFR